MEGKQLTIISDDPKAVSTRELYNLLDRIGIHHTEKLWGIKSATFKINIQTASTVLYTSFKEGSLDIQNTCLDLGNRFVVIENPFVLYRVRDVMLEYKPFPEALEALGITYSVTTDAKDTIISVETPKEIFFHSNKSYEKALVTLLRILVNNT